MRPVCLQKPGTQGKAMMRKETEVRGRDRKSQAQSKEESRPQAVLARPKESAPQSTAPCGT